MRTGTRMDNLVRIVDALRIQPMAISDVMELLNYSKSGARSYLAELVRHHVVAVTEMQPRPGHPPVGIYQILSDAAVDRFLGTVSELRSNSRVTTRDLPDGTARRYMDGSKNVTLVHVERRALPRDEFTDALFMRKVPDA